MTNHDETFKLSGGDKSRDVGLDGLRALAVVAVFAFHLAPTVVPGGFIGVDLFFVLSGFLITRILLRQWQPTSGVSLAKFWSRRVRRLMPALLLILAANAAMTIVLAHDQVFRLRGDTAAGLLFVSNWAQIRWYGGYFGAAERPSSLQHLWSLAIEMQFYLVWPLVIAGVAALSAWLSNRAVLVILLALCVTGIISSILLMAQAYGSAGVARAYYGTDTHVFMLLGGAALAIVGTNFFLPKGPVGRRLAEVATVLALAAFGAALLWVTDQAAQLFKGGYGLLLIVCVALVVGATKKDSYVAAALSLSFLTWIGKRSYGIYLWHWPIIVLTQSDSGASSVVKGVFACLQVLLTVLLAWLSYKFVETPILERGFREHFRFGLATGKHSRRSSSALPGVTLTLAVILGVATLSLPSRGDAPAGIEVDQSRERPTVSLPSVAADSKTQNTRAHEPDEPAPPRPFSQPINVSFFGDSQGMTLLVNRPAGLEPALTLSDSTVEGCGVLVGTITSATGYERDLSSDCGDWAVRWRQSVESIKPQIAVVEIGAWDVFDIRVDGQLLPFGTPEWDRNFDKQLQVGIQVLVQAGAQVALLGVPCYRPIAAGGLPLLPERGDDSRTRHINELLAESATRLAARVFFIAPPEQFCTDPAIASNTAFRWDGTHFYIPGAELMFQALLPQLLRIPGPS